MSSKDIAIKAENISKCYRIGLKENRHDSVGAAILGFLRSPIKNYQKYRSLYRFDHALSNSTGINYPDSPDILWALREVSFELKCGEALGVIGRNGAGKSTLLKILSRITDPTTGRAEIQGRVSSLLEVGTGFHRELTGRENVYLNGTILGMRKREVDSKFDEIVDFSGVERFIDTPVKRYSTGMTVRLAFSVAAHLEPEILIVDEVLAVGDGDTFYLDDKPVRVLGIDTPETKSPGVGIFIDQPRGPEARGCRSPCEIGITTEAQKHREDHRG